MFVVAGVGELVCGGVGRDGCLGGTVGGMDRGCAIKFSYGRAVVSVVVRFYRGDLRQTYYNLEKRLAVA